MSGLPLTHQREVTRLGPKTHKAAIVPGKLAMPSDVMPDPLSPIQRTIMLHQIDAVRGMARFYMLPIERDLFGTTRPGLDRSGYAGSRHASQMAAM